MASAWCSAFRLGVLLVQMTAAAKNHAKLGGVWASDSAKSEPGQCRSVESMMLYVEYTAPRVTVIELVNDEAGGHLLKRQLIALRQSGTTIQLQPVQQANEVSARPEQWTLSRGGNQLSIRRRCGPSVQRIVFHRSTTAPD